MVQLSLHLDRKFNDDLLNKSSSAYRALADEVEKDMFDVLSSVQLVHTVIGVQVQRFFNGSTGVVTGLITDQVRNYFFYEIGIF